MKRFLPVLFALLSPLSAQTFSFGAKGGVPLLDQTPYNDQSRPYTVGPYVELGLPASFAVEADFLYQRIGTTSFTAFYTPAAVSLLTARLRGNDWEFPLLGKYYFHPILAGARPFVATGFAFRTVGFQSSGVFPEVVNPVTGVISPTPLTSHYRSDLGVGTPVAVGLRFHVGRFAVSPEIRYIRWGQSSTALSKNEAQFLLGLSF